MHVGGDRRVLARDFDRRVREAVLVVLKADDVTDVDAADAHVGLFGERQRAREDGREAVALRLERHGTSERLPQEQQQPEAAQREQHDHEDVGQRRRALLHQRPPPLAAASAPKALCLEPSSFIVKPLPEVERVRTRAAAALPVAAPGLRPCATHSSPVGGLKSATSRRTVALTSPAPFRIGSTSQFRYTSVRPTGPCASAVLSTLLRSWLAHSRKNMSRPCSSPGCRRAR